MNVMLSKIEKRQFDPKWQSAVDILNRIKLNWEEDYSWLTICITNQEDICFNVSEDILQVVLDNLILNSVQQNDNKNRLTVTIAVREVDKGLLFTYKDDGKGLDKKYRDNPRKILEVHETTRKKGHGLGMWIVNNTIVMSGGQIEEISGHDGFEMQFTIGSAE